MARLGQTLLLTEFGKPALITGEDWNAGWSESCELLQRIGALRIQSAERTFFVEAAGMVGALRMPGAAIRIEPRWPEAYSALRQILRDAPTRAVAARDQIRVSAELHANDPAAGFTAKLREVLSEGLPKNYVPAEFATQRPRGKLLTGRTFRALHAAGVKHKAWCRVSELVADSRLVSLLHTATRVLQADPELSQEHRRTLLGLATWFDGSSECSVAEALRMSEDLPGADDRPDVEELLHYARAVLQVNVDVWTVDEPVTGGECRFANMARLWELAIVEMFRRNHSHEVDVADHPYGSKPPYLLSKAGPTINPDVAIHSQGRRRCVVDAKYSNATAPVAADVYQVVCYAERLGFPSAGLIYLSEESWQAELGESSHGVQVFAYGVSRVTLLNSLKVATDHLLSRTVA